MRYGVLSDIHANLPALRAALASLRAAGVDGYLCCGDLVGYGPEPNEAVEIVAGLGAVCVAGNHDLIALGQLSDERCVPLARASLRWTQGVLRADTRQFLAALPRTAEIGDLVLAHGSLADPEEYVERPEQAERQLEQLAAEYPGAAVLLLGHTHRPWIWSRVRSVEPAGPVEAPLPGSPCLLNPGSVGKTIGCAPLARCLILDLERREVSFHAVPYDHTACRRALLQQGLDPRSCYFRPSIIRSWGSRLKRLALRTAGAAGVRF